MIRRVIAWIGRRELSLLLGIALVAAGLWAFAELADEVVEGETHQIDRAVLLALRSPDDKSDPLGPEWVEELLRDFTALGGIGVLTFITVAVAGYLLLENKPFAALFVVVAIVGGVSFSMGLKELFARARPDLVPHGSKVMTASFPSGHAMMSAATYFTLGALLARLHRPLRLKAYFLLLAATLSLVVGFSRVYLGVHWPTDVLAGWTLGAAWAVVCWLAARYLQRGGRLRPEPDEPELEDWELEEPESSSAEPSTREASPKEPSADESNGEEDATSSSETSSSRDRA